MSCDHNILSHASSFGWWAAFVNKNPNKKTFMQLAVITKYMSFLGLIVLLLSVEKGL